MLRPLFTSSEIKEQTGVHFIIYHFKPNLANTKFVSVVQNSLPNQKPSLQTNIGLWWLCNRSGP